MPVRNEAWKGVMNSMGISENVIHKGEKEERYHLYVEDYVMSYLKNYGARGNGTVFFFGKRERKEKKYYIYGAGEQKQIPYFEKYELLDEITYRDMMDMPVFYISESSRTYELTGYDIFYQSNEAMQNYMVEQRKKLEAEDKARADGGSKTYTHGRGQQINGRDQKILESRERPQAAVNVHKKPKNGLMAAQLSAIFVILAAIVINSTNSYTKLTDLTQAAVEVFFAMENQDASEVETADSDSHPEANVLRLEDLDAKFEEENQVAKQEDAESDQIGEAEKNENKENENNEAVNGEEDAQEQEVAAMDEISPSEQAFARNFAEFYQVQKGDTLNTISIKIYGDISKVQEICELNQITDPDNIKYGQKILLPQ